MSAPISGSPVKFNPRAVANDRKTVHSTKEQGKQNRVEMANRFLGPVEPRTFLDKFMPRSGKSLKVPNSVGAWEGLDKKTPERKMYDPWIKCVVENGFCPGYKFIVTSTTTEATQPGSDPTKLGKPSPDVGLYLKRHAPKGSKGSKPQPDWLKMELFVEFKSMKRKTEQDPFYDDKDDFEARAQLRETARGQIITYASKLFESQHRTHAFSLLVLGDEVRFIRWDRSGAIVSIRHNYVADPSLLVEFLWRFAHLNDQHRGYDTTATLLTEKMPDYHLMDQVSDQVKLQRPQYQFDLWSTSISSGNPRYKLQVTCGTSSSSKKVATRYFLVGKPIFVAPGMTGRGTRGYVALDAETKDLVFLKDCWRIALPGFNAEGDILEDLNTKNVLYVPTVICHGDVRAGKGKQHTLTDKKWALKPENRRFMKAHVHYRLVVREIGRPLKSFTTARELVHAIYDAIFAHYQAYENAHILHRDISTGNILIYVDENKKLSGLLNDWDMSKNVESSDSSNPRQPDRTGTWQFMSAELLRHPDKVHTVSDDLESFIYVLIHEAVRWLKNNCTDVLDFYTTLFETYLVKEGTVAGGVHKILVVTHGALLTATEDKEIKFSNPQVQTIVSTSLKWFKTYYEKLKRLRSEAEARLQTQVSGSTPVGTLAPSEDSWHDLVEIDEASPEGQDQLSDSSSTEAPADQPTNPDQPPINTGAPTRVESHRAILKLFAKELSRKDACWPDSAITNDQLPDVGVPPGFFNTAGTASTGKRTCSQRQSGEVIQSSESERKRKLARH